MRQIAATRRRDRSLRRCDELLRLHCCCDKTFVLGTQANLEKGKCELVPNLAWRTSEGVKKEASSSVYDAAR